MTIGPASSPIVVAVDLLPGSETPIVWALQYAKLVNAPVEIVHVIHERASAPGFYNKLESQHPLPEPLEAGAARMMRSLLERLSAKHPELASPDQMNTTLQPGIPGSRIAEIAERTSAQLVVLGHRKRNGFQRFLEGSTAGQLLERTPVPLVVIRTSPEAQQ